MIITILTALAAVIVLIKGVGTVAAMSPKSSHAIRYAWIALTVGALALLFSLAEPVVIPPSWAQLLFEWSVAALVFFDRRGRTGGAA